MASLTVMTRTVENLFLPEADDTDQKQPRFQSKLAALAAEIEQPQPDMFALQEIAPGGAIQPGMLKGEGRSTDGCG
jgi:hypothetical protein